jgi:hypothetical protein
MKQSFLDKFMSRKGLATSFWIIALIMVSALIYYLNSTCKCNF